MSGVCVRTTHYVNFHTPSFSHTHTHTQWSEANRHHQPNEKKINLMSCMYTVVYINWRTYVHCIMLLCREHVCVVEDGGWRAFGVGDGVDGTGWDVDLCFR